MQILLQVRTVENVLLFFFVFLTSAGMLTHISAHVYETEWIDEFDSLFNLMYENNIPTWYISILTLVCAITLFGIGKIKKRVGDRYKFHWYVLSFGFLYISVDEFVVIHEIVNTPLRESLGLGGVLYYPWVLPAIVILVILVAFFAGFLRGLDAVTRRRFIVAGAIYVGGAVGTEFPVAYWYDLHGGDLVYGLMNWLQESLEMLGASIFCSSLFSHLAEHFADTHFRVSSGRTRS